MWSSFSAPFVNSNFQFDTAGGSRVWSGPSSSAGFNSLFLTDGGPNGDFSFQNTLPDSRDLADGIYTFGFYGDLLGVDVSAARTAAFGDFGIGLGFGPGGSGSFRYISAYIHAGGSCDHNCLATQAVISSGGGVTGSSGTSTTVLGTEVSLLSFSISSGADRVGTSSTGANGFADIYGSFTIQVGSVAPIPEPETNAMMLAGLGLLGFFARRRKYPAA